MAIRYENLCCNCAVPGYPCRGNMCALRHAEVHYCDNPKCNNELNPKEIYEVDGEEFCLDCLKEMFRKEC